MRKMEIAKDQKNVKQDSLPTSQEIAFDEVKERKEQANPFKVEKDKDNSATNSAETREEFDLQLYRTFGTTDKKCGLALLQQVTAAHPKMASGFQSDDMILVMNQITPLLHGMAPRDELEGMLAVQAVAVHNLAMEMAKRATVNSNNSTAADSYVNRLIKLNRTFTAQIEALGKYRNRGNQKMTVKHIHVNDGGQAIVGNIAKGGCRE